jgi:hypothetical protein
MERPPYTQDIAKGLNAQDLRALAADIYSQWLSIDADAKKKGALLLFGVHANDSDVTTLHKQLLAWTKDIRYSLAADAVKAIALSGRDLGLMYVASMAKFKHKLVRNAANESFALAASAMGISMEELADKIVPDLGFNQNGEREFDFGSRKFTAFLTSAQTLGLKDSTGKTIANLPKPNAKDDAAKAATAKNEYATLKKSLKAVAAIQATRLEYALSSGRKWTIEAWTKLFMQNPLMHSFATGLIWGFYKDDKLVNAFRYDSDGSISDDFNDPLNFADYNDCMIGLMHPIEISGFSRSAWEEQLHDYEITQPFLQLYRPMFTVTDAEQEAKTLERFSGINLLRVVLINKLVAMGWINESSLPYVYKDFPESQLTVKLYSDFGDDIELKHAEFITKPAGDLILLKNLPVKIFSEVVYNISEASKSGSHKEKN